MGKSEQKVKCKICSKEHDGARKEMHIEQKVVFTATDLCYSCFKKVAANKQKGR